MQNTFYNNKIISKTVVLAGTGPFSWWQIWHVIIRMKTLNMCLKEDWKMFIFRFFSFVWLVSDFCLMLLNLPRSAVVVSVKFCIISLFVLTQTALKSLLKAKSSEQGCWKPPIRDGVSESFYQALLSKKSPFAWALESICHAAVGFGEGD